MVSAGSWFLGKTMKIELFKKIIDEIEKEINEDTEVSDFLLKILQFLY